MCVIKIKQTRWVVEKHCLQKILRCNVHTCTAPVSSCKDIRLMFGVGFLGAWGLKKKTLVGENAFKRFCDVICIREHTIKKHNNNNNNNNCNIIQHRTIHYATDINVQLSWLSWWISRRKEGHGYLGELIGFIICTYARVQRPNIF